MQVASNRRPCGSAKCTYDPRSKLQLWFLAYELSIPPRGTMHAVRGYDRRVKKLRKSSRILPAQQIEVMRGWATT